MRATLDKVISWTGLVLALVLLVAGGLLTWASAFIGDEVHDQLSEQRITMPQGDQLEGLSAENKKALEEFAGQPLDNGPAAKAYADNYIKAHMEETADGKTYSEVSGEFIATCVATDQPADNCEELAQTRQTLFMGDTLRGLLLYGFAFATIGTIAMYAAIAAYVGALVLLVLGVLGLRHARQVSATERGAATA